MLRRESSSLSWCTKCKRNSIGRASDFQSESCEFEPRPLLNAVLLYLLNPIWCDGSKKNMREIVKVYHFAVFV